MRQSVVVEIGAGFGSSIVFLQIDYYLLAVVSLCLFQVQFLKSQRGSIIIALSFD